MDFEDLDATDFARIVKAVEAWCSKKQPAETLFYMGPTTITTENLAMHLAAPTNEGRVLRAMLANTLDYVSVDEICRLYDPPPDDTKIIDGEAVPNIDPEVTACEECGLQGVELRFRRCWGCNGYGGDEGRAVMKATWILKTSSWNK